MNPTGKGWLKAYTENYFNEETIRKLSYSKRAAGRYDKFLYRMMQSTGLLYGYPSGFYLKIHPDFEKWTNKEKIKLITAECLINFSIFSDSDSKNLEISLETGISEAIKRIASFYKATMPDIAARIKHKSSYEFVGKMIDKRVVVKSWFTKSVWTGFFQNSLVFLDVVCFAGWLRSPGKYSAETYCNYRNLFIHVIISAALSDGIVSRSEQNFFNYYLCSAQFDKEEAGNLAAILQKGEMPELQLNPRNASWLVRKYCLELALLTIWTDRLVNEPEMDFIKQLAEQLGFGAGELEASKNAVESFVFAHFSDIHYFEDRHDYQLLAGSMKHRFIKLIRKNKAMLIQEISESRELVELLSKSRKQKLTGQEREKVKEQILDILKTIPSLAIFMLPFGSIILPVILSILPEELLIPSSFKNKKDVPEKQE